LTESVYVKSSALGPIEASALDNVHPEEKVKKVTQFSRRLYSLVIVWSIHRCGLVSMATQGVSYIGASWACRLTCIVSLTPSSCFQAITACQLRSRNTLLLPAVRHPLALFSKLTTTQPTSLILFSHITYWTDASFRNKFSLGIRGKSICKSWDYLENRILAAAGADRGYYSRPTQWSW